MVATRRAPTENFILGSKGEVKRGGGYGGDKVEEREKKKKNFFVAPL
jgi:hypothetical protein